MVKEGYIKGLVTKDAFEVTLRANQASHGEIRSIQREKKEARYRTTNMCLNFDYC